MTGSSKKKKKKKGRDVLEIYTYGEGEDIAVFTSRIDY